MEYQSTESSRDNVLGLLVDSKRNQVGGDDTMRRRDGEARELAVVVTIDWVHGLGRVHVPFDVPKAPRLCPVLDAHHTTISLSHSPPLSPLNSVHFNVSLSVPNSWVLGQSLARLMRSGRVSKSV